MSGSTSTRVFYGFYSADTDTTKTSDAYDIDLINADLTIAFQTLPGERLMRPDYGCLIWGYLMEPLDYVRDSIIAEAQRIVGLDSRLQLQDTAVYSYQQGIRVELTLLYAPFAVKGNYTADFVAAQTTYFQGTTT